MKGWSCCAKRVVDFDDFLKMPGCSHGKHSLVIPEEPAAAPAAPKAAAGKAAAPQGNAAATVETYTTSTPVFKSQAVAPATSAAETPAPVVDVEEDMKDEADRPVDVGAACLRKGCKSTYVDDTSRTDPCHYHHGVRSCVTCEVRRRIAHLRR